MSLPHGEYLGIILVGHLVEDLVVPLRLLPLPFTLLLLVLLHVLFSKELHSLDQRVLEGLGLLEVTVLNERESLERLLIRLFNSFLKSFISTILDLLLSLCLSLEDLEHLPVLLDAPRELHPALPHHPQCEHVRLQLLVQSEPCIRVVLDHERIEADVLIFEEEELLSEIAEPVRLTQVLTRVMLHYVSHLMQHHEG